MPRKSGKQKIIEFLIANAVNKVIWPADMENGSDYSEFDEIMDELMEDVLVVLAYRRGIEAPLRKSSQCRGNVLATLDDKKFREMLRVDRSQFARLVKIISDDTELQRKHVSLQIPIELQLAIVLYRLGRSGENASVRAISTTFGIGFGGTVLKITQRIFRVFLKLRPKYIFWPNSTERAKIVEQKFEELPHCIGYIAGTEIKLSEAPSIDPDLYFSPNHNYCIKAQIVCDYKLQIRDLVVGSPGSIHYADVFEKCQLFKQKQNFFSSNQWLAGSIAYPLSDVVITPYNTNVAQIDLVKRKRFNFRLHQYHTRARHCIDLLTERFGSLKELRVRLRGNHKFVCEWVTVCCILYNILRTDAEIENFTRLFDDAQEESAERDINEDSLIHKQLEIKRQTLYHLMFP